MPTTIIKTVKPSGGDYTSLAAAEAGEQRDLTAVDQICEIDCYAMTDTTAVSIAGWTTDATRYVVVNVPASERHKGLRATGYRIVASTGFGDILAVNMPYTRLQGIAASNAAASGNSQVYNITASCVDVRVSDCIAYDAAYSFAFLTNCGTNVYFDNCIAMNCGNGNGNAAFHGGTSASYTAYLDNCAAVNCGIGFHQDDFRSMVLTNCYAGGNAGGDFTKTANATLTLTTCLSSDGSLGSTVAAFSTANFTNVTPGSEDLSLPAGSALIDAGTDLSTDPNWVDPGGAVDIIGTARPQGAAWDVGAFEFLASGGTTVSSSDFGVGVSATTLKAGTSSAESALGAEAVSLSSVFVGADAFSGTDQQVLEHLFSSQDSAAGADVSNVAGALVGTDSGLAEDSGNAGTLFVLSGDLGSGLDYSQLRALLAVAEDGTFGDVGQTAQVMIPSSDFAQGEDVFIALNAVLAFAEQSVGVEVSSLAGFFMSGDQGAGFDVGTMVTGVFITPGGPTYLVSAKIDSGDMEIVSSRVDAGILLSGGIN